MISNVIAIEDLESHRSAITGHSYRMLGSVFDAEDAVQDVSLRPSLGRVMARDGAVAEELVCGRLA